MHFSVLSSLLGSNQPNNGIPGLVSQNVGSIIGNGPSSAANMTNNIGQQVNQGTGGQFSGIIGQATSAVNNSTTSAPGNQSVNANSASADSGPTQLTATEALQGALTGIDPTSIDAEPKMDMTTDSSGPLSGDMMPGPNLDMMWNCKHNPGANQEQCATSMQLFCSGFCSRLNCAILTNRTTCLEICSDSNPMMEPCVSAGKRKRGVQAAPSTFNVANPNLPPAAGPSPMDMQQQMMMQQMMMQQQMMMMGVGAAGAGLGAAAKGIGKAFKK